MRKAIICAAIAAAAGTATAGTVTQVNLVNGAGSERGVGEILSTLTGVSMSNSDVNAAPITTGIGTRISDDIDQVWRDGTVHVGFAALYWGNGNTPDGNARHTISVTENNATTTQLFEAGPNTGTARGEVFSSGVFPTTDDLRFVARNHRSNKVANTDAANNEGGTRDRVITFDITGLETLRVSDLGLGGEDIDLTALPPLAEGKGAYLMFFETGSDNDFQDFVMLAYNVRPVTAIPTPTAAAAGLIGLGGLAARRRR